MEKTENGVKKSKYFPQFAATMGIEQLLYVIDYFNKNTEKLNFTFREKWENFDEILDAVAASKWKAYITNIPPQARTDARFNAEINASVGSYAESQSP